MGIYTHRKERAKGKERAQQSSDGHPTRPGVAWACWDGLAQVRVTSARLDTEGEVQYMHTYTKRGEREREKATIKDGDRWRPNFAAIFGCSIYLLCITIALYCT